MRGLVIGGMVLGLLMGCNNGGEDPQKVFLKSVVSLGNDFLNIFTSFGEMAGSALGFKKDPQKSDVANYFKKMQETVQGTKEKLEKIVIDMKSENNPNAENVGTVVKTLIDEKLSKIIEGASEALKGSGGEGAVGNVATGASGDVKGSAGEANSIKFITEGLVKIVGVVLEGKGNHEAGDDKGPVQDSGSAGDAGNARGGSTGSTHGDARNLFANDQAGSAVADTAKAAKDAAKAVSSVTGADILKAISQGDNGKAFKLASNSDVAYSSIGNVATNAKDAEVAGGIALRAMAKGGKFTGPTGSSAKPDVAKAVKGAAVSAVTKALDTLTIAIRKTIDEGLKGVKEAMNINANDNPVAGAAK